jgi:hypothetical protein
MGVAVEIIFAMAYTSLAFNQGMQDNLMLGAVIASSKASLDTEKS